MTRPNMWDDSPEACAYRRAEVARRATPTPPCSVPECDGESRVRGMCLYHYHKWWRTGSAERLTIRWSDATVEDIEWLLSQGVAPVEVAQRMGIKPTSIWRGLNRRGRRDLALHFNGFWNEENRQARAKRRGLSVSP